MNSLEPNIQSPFEDLLYSGQFILGPHFIEKFGSWKKVEIRPLIRLMVHPHLNVQQCVRGNRSLTLLGFILDPDNPQATDADILASLMSQLTNCGDFMPATYKFGGRWILIMDDGVETGLLHDAVGLRQIYYSDTHFSTYTWCGSEPGVLAGILNYKIDTKAWEFINSPEFLKQKEANWPFQSSPYKEIKHLLPNHWLHLQTGRCERYWPDGPLSPLDVDEAVQLICADLEGLMNSALNRFDLVMALTAGWDSRVLLAASKDIVKKIHSFVTVQQKDMLDSHPDLTIPSLLLRRCGLKHDIINATIDQNEAFMNVYNASVSFPHRVWASDAQAILEFYSRNKVAVVGSVSEQGRCYYFDLMQLRKRRKLTAQDLSVRYYGGINPFVVASNEEWLSGLLEIHNYDMLELFLWEQGHGNWLATSQLEFGMVWKEIFTPFNCRRLLMTMLSVDQKYRKPPQYTLHKKIILDLWPELLSTPINPHRKASVRRKFIRIFMACFYRISSLLPLRLKNLIKKWIY